MSLSIHLLIIDPQNDFCVPNGTLFVPGADQDMSRLAAMVDRLSSKIADIHVTLDSHRLVDIAHPIWFKDSSGNHPNPFTIITAADVESGTWTTTIPSFRERTLDYLKALESGGRYPHCIWPPHCRIGSWGHNVYPELFDSLARWESQFALVDFVTKGSNPWTEHFSGLQAEVPDPSDHTTQLNTTLIEVLEKADIVLIAGEARSHCVANTIRDLAANIDAASVSKLVLLTDAMSDVGDPPGTTMFSDLGKALIRDLTAMGAKTSTTLDFLS